MPLSEHEQRLLDQIERALYAEDPKFASTVRSTDLRTHMRRRLRRAAAVFVDRVRDDAVRHRQRRRRHRRLRRDAAGPRDGAVGLAPARHQPGRPTSRAPSKGALRAVDGKAQRPVRKKSSSSGSPLEKLEERWKRRWDERGGPG